MLARMLPDWLSRLVRGRRWRSWCAVAMMVASCTSTPVPATTKPSNPSTAPASPATTPDRAGLASLGYLDNMLARVESGDWATDFGILASMNMIEGRASPIRVLLQRPVVSDDLTGIIATAREYLEQHRSSAVADELDYLLQSQVFDTARLDAMTVDPAAPSPTIVATPSPQPISGPSSSAALSFPPIPPPVYDNDCQRFFRRFSIGPGVTRCLDARTGHVGTVSYKVYSPAPSLAAFGWNDSYQALVDQALSDAIPAYLKLGSLPPFDLVLSVNVDVPAGGAAVMNGDRCLIMIYTDAQRRDADALKQLIAQQLAHCFQAATFPDQERVPYAARSWREDGLAVYLGSVVYPSVHSEWNMLPQFQRVDQSGSLLEWSAASFLWWQFLADQQGWEGIRKLVQSLPSGGDLASQMAAVAHAPGMAELFGQFAQAYVDGTIGDASGTRIPTAWVPSDSEEQGVAQAGPWSTDALVPFQLTHRLFVIGDSDQASLTSTTTPDVVVVSRPERRATWGSLPSLFPADCASDGHLVVLTYSRAASGIAHSALAVSDLKDSRCHNDGSAPA